MIWPVLLFTIATQTAAPVVSAPPTADRLRLLVLDFSAEGDVPAGLVGTVNSLVSAELSTYPDLDVIANADVRRMVELEGARQESGCGDTSCLAELAGALGARLVVFGSVGRLGSATVVNLNLFDSVTAQSAGREFVEVKDPSELPRVLPNHVRSLLKRTYAEAGLVLPPEKLITASVPAPVKQEQGPVPVVLVAAGAGGVIVGAAGGFLGLIQYSSYVDSLALYKEKQADNDVSGAKDARQAAINSAAAWNSWGAPAAVGGGVLLVAGAISVVVGTVALVSGEN